MAVNTSEFDNNLKVENMFKKSPSVESNKFFSRGRRAEIKKDNC